MNVMKRFLLFLGLLTIAFTVQAQDTLTVMQYNLLYYGINTDFCTSANNSLEVKDPALRLILDEVKPDIFTVNEISSTITVHQHLLDADLNIDGSTKYMKAAQRPVAYSSICSMLFYNSLKLKLKKQSVAQSVVRDINMYELYYISDDLAQGDTAFVICLVAHLKAGNSSEDEATRKIMVDNTMEYLENGYQSANLLFMGDFNYYTAFEPGFQSMTNYSVPALRFYDPVDRIGSWNNNDSYSDIHTQSTHTSSNGCASTGGMDDRFDFVLISDEIRDGASHVKYIQDSYHAFGQDGNRFNGYINGSPVNSEVTQEMADALYNMSDHLPVVMKLRVDKTLDINEIYHKPFVAEIAPNPVLTTGFKTNLLIKGQISGIITIELFDLRGNRVHAQNQQNASVDQTMALDFGPVSAGIYLLRITGENGFSQVLKVVKIQ
jgi:endonuclease/exonuclease/phosphatase family metal-dependent hydrolase